MTAIAATVVLIPSSAKAEWIYATSGNGFDILIEDSSVTNQGNTVSYWQQDVWERPFKGQAKQVISQYALNCSNSSNTTITSTAYNSSGKPLTNPALSSRPGSIRTNLPGTIGYTIQQMICGN